MSGVLRVGMSGFSYPEWVGDFYPAGTKREGMLSYYATRFDAVEINMTFRRQAAETTIERWHDATGDDFRFTMKAHQRITHWKRLVDASEDVGYFVERARGLGARLGPVLFQTPPKLTFDADVLDAFCAGLPPGYLYAFEPRHPSFEGPGTGSGKGSSPSRSTGADEVLHRHGVARCCNDDIHDIGSYRVTGPVAYFRFHREAYTPDELAVRAELVKRIAADGTDVYAFFAHEDNPESVRPALALRKLVG